MLQQYYLEFFKKHVYYYIIYAILHIYVPLSSIALPHYYGKLISTLKGGDIDAIQKVFIILIGIWITIQTLNIAKSYLNANLYPKFIGFVREKIINRVIDSYKGDYEDLKTGKLLTKIIDSPYIFYHMAKETKNLVVNNLIIYLSTLGYLFYYDKFIGMIYIISVVVVCYITYVYINQCKPYIIDSEESYTDSNEEVDDAISNLLSIYSSNTIKDEKGRLQEYNINYIKAEKSLYDCNNKYRIYFSIAFVIIFIVLNFFSLKIYLDNTIKLDVLVSIVIINYSILTGFMSIFYDTKDFIDNKERLDILEDYLDKMPKIIKNTRNGPLKTNQVFAKPFVNIEFKNITFKYQEKNILQNFNLHIKPKEKIGLIGNIGSGKSTLVKLIVGLKSNYTGQILINGKDIKSLNIDKLRNFISYIPQHPKLFNRTLYENITYGLENVSEKKIYQTLTKVNLESIRDIFKRIMHKKVGKNGSKLSGGQRQIVWLIRSLLKDNRMIILDEPTSSLDEDNKMKVVRLIEELSKSRNIILITHDNAILKNMNRIIKLKEGKIIEDKIV